MLSIFGVSLVLYFIKILSGSRNTKSSIGCKLGYTGWVKKNWHLCYSN
jgi:hypothetical protein